MVVRRGSSIEAFPLFGYNLWIMRSQSNYRELEKTIGGEFDKENIAELGQLKAELLRVLDGLENKVQ